MQSLHAVDAIAGEGLAGDRYQTGSGHWHPVESCQVTLLSADDMERAHRRLPVALDHGEHRRNLVITGMRTRALEGRRFRIGSVLFEYGKPRPPCGYINQVTGENMAKALGRNSGVCLLVLEGGRLQVGDTLSIIPPETT
ncbi:MOSC domain-containing protein [Thioalkalivibrio sp.]|uniref:MOSC domain-containing protein n=1 Tax=Thioalkalivibrio sp. TaxID=2093813 RepID=UPI0039772043